VCGARLQPEGDLRSRRVKWSPETVSFSRQAVPRRAVPSARRSLGMSGRPTTLSTLPRGSISNASKPPRWSCTHARRTVDTSSAKNRFTDFRAPCATIAHSANDFSATVYAKVVSAPSKNAYLSIAPFPPIRSGSNNRQLSRPGDATDWSQHERRTTPPRTDRVACRRLRAQCIHHPNVHSIVPEPRPLATAKSGHSPCDVALPRGCATAGNKRTESVE
jgi:hypothetical protein